MAQAGHDLVRQRQQPVTIPLRRRAADRAATARADRDEVVGGAGHDASVERQPEAEFGQQQQFVADQRGSPALRARRGFDGIQNSPRHKSGIAVRFPRILRWREDKSIKDADSLKTIHELLEGN